MTQPEFTPLPLNAEQHAPTEALAGAITPAFALRLLNTVEQAVIVTDAHGLISFWNGYAETLYGWSAAEVVGRPVAEVTPAEGLQADAREIVASLIRGEPYRGEFMVQGKDGRRFPVMVVDTPVHNDEGELVGIVGVSWDVSAEHGIAQELKEAHRAAAQAAAARNDFLAVMSHELRTPMTAILGYQELLDAGLAGPLNDQQRLHLSRIRSSAWHLLDLIEQMLSISRMDAGNEVVRPETVSIAHLIREAVSLIQPQADLKGLCVKPICCADDVTLRTDAGKLRQVLLNLLTNAVKFTTAGWVEVAASAYDDGSVEFRVSDTGMGFPAHERARIFEAFAQLDQSTTRDAGGVGLGLAVVQRLVTLLGGTITAESEPGAGSTFTFLLPPID